MVDNPKSLKELGLEIEKPEGFLPFVDSPVYQTEKGNLYLKKPGLALISIPYVDLRGMESFLKGFPPKYKFVEYLDDPTPLPPAEQLCKAAGQLCYVSFGEKRTMNIEAGRYFEDINSSGHGSVLEHANFSFLIWGAPRSFTHELVRHRAGMGYSQVSQRYVSGRVLRFVERPEYQGDTELHERFVRWIDASAEEYEARAQILIKRQQEGLGILSGETKTDLRKKVQQAARSALPNETEAPIVVTGNARAWRHILSMRASEHAEVEIRRVAFDIYRCLVSVSPILFGDFRPVHLQDGTHSVRTPYPKV